MALILQTTLKLSVVCNNIPPKKITTTTITNKQTENQQQQNKQTKEHNNNNKKEEKKTTNNIIDKKRLLKGKKQRFFKYKYHTCTRTNLHEHRLTLTLTRTHAANEFLILLLSWEVNFAMINIIRELEMATEQRVSSIVRDLYAILRGRLCNSVVFSVHFQIIFYCESCVL